VSLQLTSDPPPLPLTLHLSHLLLIYLAALPVSLLCVVTGPYLIVITLIAGWCLLGLEALIAEVGGVFGHSGEPLPEMKCAVTGTDPQRTTILYLSSPIKSSWKASTLTRLSSAHTGPD